MSAALIYSNTLTRTNNNKHTELSADRPERLLEESARKVLALICAPFPQCFRANGSVNASGWAECWSAVERARKSRRRATASPRAGQSLRPLPAPFRLPSRHRLESQVESGPQTNNKPPQSIQNTQSIVLPASCLALSPRQLWNFFQANCLTSSPL